MTSSELSARLRFLDNSAHLLSTIAPATSRHLMLRHNDIMFENKLELSDSQKRKSCSACGTIMIVGWNGTLWTEARRSGREKGIHERERVKTAKVMVYNCEACGRNTRHPIAASPPRRPKLPLATSTLGSKTLTSANTPTAPSTISSSKKRSKTRKQSSLQAILARKKAPEPSGFGLDLMDFMKKT